MTREETIAKIRAMCKEEKRPSEREALRVAADELETAEYWTNKIPNLPDTVEGYEAIAQWLWGELRHSVVHEVYDPMDRILILHRMNPGTTKGYARAMHEMLTEYAERYLQAVKTVCGDQGDVS